MLPGGAGGEGEAGAVPEMNYLGCQAERSADRAAGRQGEDKQTDAIGVASLFCKVQSGAQTVGGSRRSGRTPQRGHPPP